MPAGRLAEHDPGLHRARVRHVNTSHAGAPIGTHSHSVCRSWMAGFDIRATKEVRMKYVILIRHNVKALELWASLPPEQRAEGLAAYEALNADLAASGELIVSEALAH